MLVDKAHSFEEHSSLKQNIAFVVCLSNVWTVEMRDKDVPCLRYTGELGTGRLGFKRVKTTYCG